MEFEAKLIVPYQRICELLPEDIVEILELYDLWQLALKKKDYITADQYRQLYKEWDIGLGSPDTWNPIFESTSHYQQRLQRNLSRVLSSDC